jgi:uncharacterized protein YndB with AHSA1/START domain
MTTVLQLTRDLPAPPQRVWRALTDPAALAGWFWPAASFGTTVEVDARPGGRYRIIGRTAGIGISGEYVKVDPPHQLVFTWRWDGEPDETLVTIMLAETPGGCTLRLVHEGFADESDRDGNAQGWSDCLDRLPAWLTAAVPS